MDKLSRFDDKWPGQESATPIGSPPKGMWYDPAVKDGASIESAPTGASLNDALRYFIANPTILGRPAHINIKDRTVQFDTGKTVSFDEVMQFFSKQSIEKKESDYGFMDSPKDVGKKPDGDFPSVQWMPRGTEDGDVDADTVMSSLGLSKLDIKAGEEVLTPDQMNEVAASYGPEYNSALNHFSEALKNGHPKDKALEYAISEMQKLGIAVSPTTLLEVVKNYLPVA